MQPKLIILAESNPIEESSSMLVLKDLKLDQETIVLRDGIELLKFLKDQKNNGVQLLILALDLANTDVSSMLQEIRNNESTKHLSIILLKSSGLDPIDPNPLASQIATKPLTSAQLTAALMYFLNYWIKLTHPSPSVNPLQLE